MKRQLLYPAILLFIIGSALFYGKGKPSEKEVQTLITPQQIIQESKGNPQTRPMIEWLSDEEFALYKGCGTECEAVYIFNIKENFTQKLYYGVRHTWSPSRQYVLAYNYAIQPGITVGDRFGNALFTLRRSYSPNRGTFSSQQASWSPDSSKLALIIQKEHEEGLELLVFDVERNFNLLTQQDLESDTFSHLGWKDEKIVFYEVDGEMREMTLE